MKPSEVIRTYGWIQNELGDPQRGFCLRGALCRAVGCRTVGYTQVGEGSNVMSQMARACERYVCSAYGFSGCIEDWNDTPGRTKEEVLALLESVGL